jgi:hypothetical protein
MIKIQWNWIFGILLNIQTNFKLNLHVQNPYINWLNTMISQTEG